MKKRILLMFVLVPLIMGGVVLFDFVLAYCVDYMEVKRQERELHDTVVQFSLQHKRPPIGLISQPSSEYCKYAWDALWPIAKSGNVLARAQLRGTIFPNLKESSSYVLNPDSANYIKLFFYARARSGPINNATDKKIPIDGIVLRNIAKSERLIACLEQNNDSSCTDIAIESGVIPSFQKYVDEVDAYLKSGGVVECYPYGRVATLEK